MVFKTHIAGGIMGAEIAGIVLAQTQSVGVGQFLTLLGTAVIGSVLPDIDHRNSKITKSNPVTRTFSKLFSHRGIIHTPVLWCIIALLLVWAGLTQIWNGYGTDILIGLCAGVASHLILDTLNSGGIMWLWPLGRKKLHLAKIKVGSATETTVSYVLFAIDVILFLYLLIFQLF